MWSTIARKLADMVSSHITGKKKSGSGKTVTKITMWVLILIILVQVSGIGNPLKMAWGILNPVQNVAVTFGKYVYDGVTTKIDALWGDASDKSSDTEKKIQEKIDDYSIEDLIKVADDKDVITDEDLKEMMMERDSFKRLLQAVYKAQTSYSSATKKIQVKHTYTTTEMIPVQNNTSTSKDSSKSSADSSKNSTKDTSKKSDKNKSNTARKKKVKKGAATPAPAPQPGAGPNANTSKKDNASDKSTESNPSATTVSSTGITMEEKKTKHTEYKWKEVTFSHEDVEAQYKLYWQPVITSVIQRCIKDYGKDGKKSDTSASDSNTSTNGNSSSDKNNSSGSSNSTQYQVDTSTEGGKVAQYGLKFVGNPYVYGGSSLTKGCDCSGFVMKVYEHFGYSLPHSSSAMRSCGKKVCDKKDFDVSKLQAGDVVCYDGHVGLYIGNGKIVNASNERVGIIVYKVDYRKDLITVRRIVTGKSATKKDKTDHKKDSSTKTDKDKMESKQPAKSSKKQMQSGSVMTGALAGKKNEKTDSSAKRTNKTDKKTDEKKDTAKKDNKTDEKADTKKDDNPYEGADKVLVGNTVQAQIWNFFKAKGLSDIAVSAIMGNVEQESTFHPDCVTGQYHGLFQWGGGRWVEYKKKYPDKETDVLCQLKYAWLEMSSSSSYWNMVLPPLSRATHLDYKSASDPGAVWIFARKFEACTSDVQLYGIQEYAERFCFAKKWLKHFGGRNGTITDGKIYNSEDVGIDDDYGSSDAFSDKSIGTWDKKTGMVSLSDTDIAEIISDFKAKITYDFDIVADSKQSYKFDDCKSMKNNGLESDGGDENTEGGKTEWYTPTSTVISVALPYGDVTYDGNIPSHYYYNSKRWKGIMDTYCAYYDEKIFFNMVRTLPTGNDFAATYEYYKTLADGSSTSTPANNQNVSNADGDYESMDNVQPSIKIPEHAGGMSIPLYLQTDSRWKSVRFGGNTISTSGCSVTALAMVLSYMKNECIYPSDVVKFTGATKYYTGAGASWGIFADVAAHWGLKCKEQVVDANAIIKALQAGNPVIVSTTGYGTTQEFTRHGHFIVLRGLNSKGQVLVNDPNDNSTTKNHYMKAYSASFIVSECTQNKTSKKDMWIFTKE